MNPLDEYLEEKRGAPLSAGDAWKQFKGNLPGALAENVPKILATSAVLGLAGAAGAGVGVAAKNIYNAATKGRDFRKMLETNPDLEAHRAQNPKFFNQVFTSLRHFAPEFTKEPLVAGKYMREALDSTLGLGAGGVVVQARQESGGREPGPVMSAFLSGAAPKGTIDPLKTSREWEDRGFAMQERERKQQAWPREDVEAQRKEEAYQQAQQEKQDPLNVAHRNIERAKKYEKVMADVERLGNPDQPPSHEPEVHFIPPPLKPRFY